ncbi:hypothetical protein [Schaalia odontolytica]
MSAPVPLRAATVAGTALAVIFIILSAVVGGINAWRSHSASRYEEQAAQAQSEKVAVDQQIADAKTRLDAANVHKDAKEWCDSITRDTAASIRDAIKSYDSATQAVKDAIHEECAPKENLASAQRTGAEAAFSPGIPECTTDQITTTINGTITLNSASQISSLGPLELTISGYTLDKGTTLSPSSPYQETTTVTLTPGTPATFSISVPYDPAMSDKTECGFTMISWWPTSL